MALFSLRANAKNIKKAFNISIFGGFIEENA